MRDPGYSDSFLVFMTARNGIQFVTGKERGRIMARLLSGEHTASELAHLLDIPLSTVQSRLDSLVSRNLLESRPDPNCGNRKKYRNCAALMFHDCNGSSWYYTSKEPFIREMMARGSNHHFLILSSLLNILADLGLDFWPMVPEAGTALASISRMVKDVNLDKYYKNNRTFTTEYLPNTVLNISAKNSLEIEVVSENSKSYNSTVYLGFLAGIFRTIFPDITGHNYCQIIHVKRNNEGHVIRLSSNEFKGDTFQDSLPNVFERDLSVGQPFSIYHTNGQPIIVYNEIMLGVLSILRKGTAASTDILGQLGCPPSTLYYYLKKLEELGLVKTSGSRNKLYAVSCDCIIDTADPRSESMWSTRTLFETEEKQRDIPLILYTYLMEIIGCSGLRLPLVIKKLAEFIVERTYPYFLHMSFSEYIADVCKRYSIVSAVTWKSPIEATIHFKGNSFPNRIEMELLLEILSHAKNLLRGNNINIHTEYVGTDN